MLPGLVNPCTFHTPNIFMFNIISAWYFGLFSITGRHDLQCRATRDNIPDASRVDLGHGVELWRGRPAILAIWPRRVPSRKRSRGAGRSTSGFPLSVSVHRIGETSDRPLLISTHKADTCSWAHKRLLSLSLFWEPSPLNRRLSAGSKHATTKRQSLSRSNGHFAGAGPPCR